MDLETGNTIEYVTEASEMRAASISPDGSTVVLHDFAEGSLMIADFPDPSSLRPLLPRLAVGPDDPVAWSPDGTHIAYGNVADAAGFQAYVLDIAGGEPTRLTSFDGGLWNSSFRWSE
jgi:Tol biopolymer transport system component